MEKSIEYAKVHMEEIKAANRGWETKVKVTPLGNSRRRTKPAGETHYYSQTYDGI